MHCPLRKRKDPFFFHFCFFFGLILEAARLKSIGFVVWTHFVLNFLAIWCNNKFETGHTIIVNKYKYDAPFTNLDTNFPCSFSVCFFFLGFCLRKHGDKVMYFQFFFVVNLVFEK